MPTLVPVMPKPRRLFLLSLLLPLVALAAPAQCTQAFVPGNWSPHASGIVNAVASWDPDGAGPAAPVLLVGGRFTVGDQADVNLVQHDGASWSPLGALPAGYVRALTTWNGQVVASVSLGTGFVLVTTWTGTAWQTLGTCSGFDVNALAVYQGNLIAGGEFTAVNGTPATNIAQFDGTSWSALGSGIVSSGVGFGNVVRALAVFNGSLYVGGTFNRAGGLTSLNLAVWNGAAWASQPNFNGTVRTLAARIGTALTNSYLFAGGEFTLIGGGAAAIAATGVARFSPSTNTWTAIGGLANCRALLVRSTGLSSFELIGGTLTSTIVGDVWRWNGATNTWAGIGPGGGEGVFALGYHAGQYVQGTSSLTSVRRFSGGAWQPVAGPGLAASGRAVLDSGTDLVIAGPFGVMRGATNAWTQVGGAFNGTAQRLARMPNGDLIAGGAFTLGGGQPANNVARWDGTAWQPLGAGVDGEVLALQPLPNGHLLVGGMFLNAGLAPAPYIAKWNGVSWQSVGGGVDAPVRALSLLANGEVAVGGDFTFASGFGPVARVARWTGSAWAALGPTAGFNAAVLSLAVEPGGTLLAAGDFTQHGSTTVNGLARWNGTMWTAAGSLGTGVREVVSLPNGAVVYAGNFYVYRLGSPASNSLQGGVSALAVADNGDLLVGGDFLTVDGLVSAHVARATTPCPATVITSGLGCTGPNGPNVLTATTLPWAGGIFRATGTGLPSPAFVFAVTGLTPLPAPVPLAAVLPQALPGCDLLVNADLVDVQALPAGSTLTSQLALPPSPAVVGATFFHQHVATQLNASLAFVAVTSTNALLATIGAL